MTYCLEASVITGYCVEQTYWQVEFEGVNWWDEYPYAPYLIDHEENMHFHYSMAKQGLVTSTS